ncbi:MAG: 4Fe-4S dicluster domain-containing protein [Candidatus Eisenbacteria bacterium]
MSATEAGRPLALERHDLDRLVETLRAGGATVLGPRRRDHAVVIDEIETTADLPVGWTDEQQPGRYRLVPGREGELFGVRHGATSWKRVLDPPLRTLWRARRDERGFTLEDSGDPAPRLALLGVRACDLAALGVLDRVLGAGMVRDPRWVLARENAFVIAVPCAAAGGTCFCASMGSGPAVTGGFDVRLTELLADGAPTYVAEAGSERGSAVLATLDVRVATDAECAAAAEVPARAAKAMGRALDTKDLPGRLAGSPDHPRWEDAAARCLACGNCTSVCPTCFCHTITDVVSLDGTTAERVRACDSCFTAEFSYIHGGSVRTGTRARYRQWLTHKLAHWHTQFGVSGCVGCGRCITWCPAGIDITEEAAAVARPAETHHAHT